MKTRALAIFLIAMQLAALASCGGDTPSSDTTDAQTDAVTTADPNYPSFEKKDFGGAEFHIAGPLNNYGSYYFVEEQTGDVMSDAVYKRAMIVEEALNVDFTYEQLNGEGTNKGINLLPPLQAAAMAGDDLYQLVLTHSMNSIATIVTAGLLMDWQDVPYVDFSKPYWHSECNESLEVNGRQFYAFSDYMIVSAYGTYFNKDLVTKYELEDPYQLVRDNKWTFDKLIELASQATSDLNGDTVMDVHDQYGFASMADYPLCQAIYGAGLKLCEPGTFELAINNERMVSLVGKMHRLINESGDTYTWDPYGSEELFMPITTGQVLFTFMPVGSLASYRDSDVNLGLVPMPKLETTQEHYECVNWSGMMCVPAIVGDPEMVGQVCELLAYHSGDTTIPAYYDVLLGDKLARDEDMKEMIDYIFDHIVFDGGRNYFGLNGPMQKLFFSMSGLICRQKSSDWASYYAGYEAPAKQLIADFLTAVNELE